MTDNRTHPGISQLPAVPHALINAVLTGDRRVQLVGPPGTGKSTLVDGIATTLSQGGRTCRCLGADPGSPLFGVPGPVEVYAVTAVQEASRPGKRARAYRRTGLWDDYLAGAGECVLDTRQLLLTGTPPPLDVTGSWTGRQIGLLDGANTLAMGEVLALEGEQLRLRLPAYIGNARSLLVRDAARRADGRLGTVERFTADRFTYLPPADIAPHAPAASRTGPRPVGRVGKLNVCLVNGVFSQY